jgi:hypothetical protein
LSNGDSPLETTVETGPLPTDPHDTDLHGGPGIGGSGGDALDRDPFDDDLSDELARRAPRAALTRTTLALGGAVLVVAGFLGGVVVQKNYGTTGTTPSGNGAFNGAGGFAGRGGFAGGTAAPGTSAAPGGQRGGATTGTVKFVDGTTVYITTANGETITVKTTSTTTVRAEQSMTLAELPVGAAISVQGTTASDGTVTATQVTTTK